MGNNELIIHPEDQYLSVSQVQKQVMHIHQILKNIMVEGKVENGQITKDGHYGLLPGCGNKKILFKSGAEKLCLAFNLVPKYNISILPVSEDELTPPGHRDYEVTCELFNRNSGNFVGQGMGSCTTMEGKYRFRSEWQNKIKVKIENPCLADIYNTVKKMACKRAIVHAVIQTLAVGDIFMQDVEDMKPEDINNGRKEKPSIPPPPSKSNSNPNKITAPQMKKIQAMFNEINPGMTSDEKRTMAVTLLEKEVPSMSALTKSDAKTIIDGLDEMLAMKKETENASEAPF